MEDFHVVVTSFLPHQAACDGLSRSFYGLFDGHNGARAAETAASRLHTLLAAGESRDTHLHGLGL